VQPVTKPRQVLCPGCGQYSEYSSNNPWRPFCSERCKLIDMGQWASENYRIPERAPTQQELEDE